MTAVEGSISGELDPQGLLAAASSATGLEDFGDERFIEGMTRFLRAAVAEGNLSSAGAAGIRLNTLRLLINRLRFQDDLNKHPEILDEDVNDPLIITGLMRTGTTKLQRVMSRDPGVQGLLLYRLLDPVPAPAWRPGEIDPRLNLAQAFVDALLQQFPDFMDGHPTYADEPDEETFVMEMTFESLAASRRAWVPSYVEWWNEQPRDYPYQYLRRLMQYLQWQDGGRQDRPFVMKSPAHVGNLDQVSTTFPSATVVHCHRDPRIAVPSAARMTESFLQMSTDQVNTKELGEMSLRWAADETTRNLAQRAQLGDALNIVDVQFAEIARDPLAVIRTVYTQWGRPLTDETERHMKQWLQSDSHSKTHSYSLERYGLTEHQIDLEFAEYNARFQAR